VHVAIPWFYWFCDECGQLCTKVYRGPYDITDEERHTLWFWGRSWNDSQILLTPSLVPWSYSRTMASVQGWLHVPLWSWETLYPRTVWRNRHTSQSVSAQHSGSTCCKQGTIFEPEMCYWNMVTKKQCHLQRCIEKERMKEFKPLHHPCRPQQQ